MHNFKNFLKTKLDESELSPLQKEYQEYFEGKLKEAGVSSPAELDAAAMKKFFNGVSDGWIKGKGKK